MMAESKTPNPVDNIRNTEVRPLTNIGHDGFGLFATHDFLAGSILTFLDGQEITYTQYKEFIAKCQDPSFLEEIIEWNCIGNERNEKDEPENTYLIFRPLRTKYSYINHFKGHADEPNCEVKFNPLRVMAIKDIEEGEELLLDYTREPLPDCYFEEERNAYLL